MNRRVYKAFYAIFTCPSCETILAPTSAYGYYTGSGVLLLVLVFISYLLGWYRYDLALWLSLIVFVIGILLFIIGSVTMKLRIVTEDEIP